MFNLIKKARLFLQVIVVFSIIVILLPILFCCLYKQQDDICANIVNFSLKEPIPILKPPILSKGYNLPVMRGIRLNSNDPKDITFYFDAMDKDKTDIKDINRFINYFLEALTIPKEKIWVNLSPYERDFTMSEALKQVSLGKDLLLEDYVLKSLTSSITNPNNSFGKKFWDKAKDISRQYIKQSNSDINTFFKIWIVPKSISIIQDDEKIFIKQISFKLMLEEDYLAKAKDNKNKIYNSKKENKIDEMNKAIRDMFKRDFIPILEQQVNNTIHFAPLRQLFHCLVLADYVKQYFKNISFYKRYIDQEIVNNLILPDAAIIRNNIFISYANSFRQGVYNFLGVDYDKLNNKKLKRRYFSGGIVNTLTPEILKNTDISRAIVNNNNFTGVKINFQIKEISSIDKKDIIDKFNGFSRDVKDEFVDYFFAKYRILIENYIRSTRSAYVSAPEIIFLMAEALTNNQKSFAFNGQDYNISEEDINILKKYNFLSPSPKASTEDNGAKREIIDRFKKLPLDTQTAITQYFVENEDYAKLLKILMRQNKANSTATTPEIIFMMVNALANNKKSFNFNGENYNLSEEDINMFILYGFYDVFDQQFNKAIGDVSKEKEEFENSADQVKKEVERVKIDANKVILLKEKDNLKVYMVYSDTTQEEYIVMVDAMGKINYLARTSSSRMLSYVSWFDNPNILNDIDTPKTYQILPEGVYQVFQQKFNPLLGAAKAGEIRIIEDSTMKRGLLDKWNIDMDFFSLDIKKIREEFKTSPIFRHLISNVDLTGRRFPAFIRITKNSKKAEGNYYYARDQIAYSLERRTHYSLANILSHELAHKLFFDRQSSIFPTREALQQFLAERSSLIELLKKDYPDNNDQGFATEAISYMIDALQDGYHYVRRNSGIYSITTKDIEFLLKHNFLPKECVITEKERERFARNDGCIDQEYIAKFHPVVKSLLEDIEQAQKSRDIFSLPTSLNTPRKVGGIDLAFDYSIVSVENKKLDKMLKPQEKEDKPNNIYSLSYNVVNIDKGPFAKVIKVK